MTLNEFQTKAMETCMPTCDNFSYMMLNLVGEVGELAGKIAKHIRKGNMWIDNNVVQYYAERVSEEDIKAIRSEMGDILWQLAGLVSVFGWKFEDIARQNLDKLASRKERNVIDGNGDFR